MDSKRKRLSTGEDAEVAPMLFTTALMIGVTDDPLTYYRTRFCYETYDEAVAALDKWDGRGDPPGRWIVQKPEGRYNRDITD